jgi:hypothetical protein
MCQNEMNAYMFFEYDPEGLEDLEYEDHYRTLCSECDDQMLCVECEHCTRPICDYCRNLVFGGTSRRFCSVECMDEYVEDYLAVNEDYSDPKYSILPDFESYPYLGLNDEDLIRLFQNREFDDRIDMALEDLDEDSWEDLVEGESKLTWTPNQFKRKREIESH